MPNDSKPNGGELSQNMKNLMSDDPGDGDRESFTTKGGKGEGPTGEKPDEQDQDAVEAFGRRGSG